MDRTLLNTAAGVALLPCQVFLSGCQAESNASTSDPRTAQLISHDQPESEELVAETKATYLASFDQPIQESGLRIHFKLIEGDGEVDSFYMADREIDWDIFDAFIFELDEMPVKGTPEAETRPTRPYMLVDRGFGHAGYPAISMSLRGAEAFCLWLSEVSGRSYRLPSTAEWKLACNQGSSLEWPADSAWYMDNSDGTTHPVGAKAADANGIHDLRGNVAEWALEPDGNGVVLGGSFISPLNEIHCDHVQPFTKDWNESDPQIPKSIWWLADGAFIGFRVVSAPDSGLEKP